MKSLVIDLDNTLTINNKDLSYDEIEPNMDIVKQIDKYHKKGFQIIIFSSRNMNTYNNSIGKINANTLPLIISWLNKHKIHYDEIYIGKPWCGDDGFYVDDRAIRPDEFIKLNYKQILELINSTSLNNDKK